ncbi:hypothetical protein WJX81_000303 [Elliptochloris bilobata]|uniref:NUC153 domain-containing protein n=1 Tax=Elliptochloris bilobata TaxID=381761 RepID=A0AAW1S618_9CHLO
MSSRHGGRGRGRGRGKVITDPRFARVQTDARFQVFPSKQRTVEIDQRFEGLFYDKDFQVRAPVDKRGRKVRNVRKNEDMARYYRLKDKDDAAEPPAAQPAAGEAPARGVQETKSDKGASGSEEEEEESSEAGETDDARARWARMRGLAGPEASSSEGEEEGDEGEEASSSGGSSDAAEAASDEEVEEDLGDWGVGALAANPEEAVPEAAGDSARLAVIDLDWDRVAAVDLLALLSSFLGKGQRLARVTVYPSDFGLERMAEEARFGPRALFGGAKPAAAPLPGAGAGGPSDAAGGDSDDGAPAGSGEALGDDSGDLVDQRRLQLYERSKLRYHYAVAEFGNAAAAAHVYAECDGLEFERSANRLDLRFVPEEQSFAGRQPRDVATEVPSGYTPPPAFATAALQHTNVKLTWDADDVARKRTLARKLTQEQLHEDDFRAYLASASDSDAPSNGEAADGGGGEDAERYRQLLLSGGDAGAALAQQQRRGGKAWGAGDHAASSSGEDDDAIAHGRQAGGRPGGGRDVDMQVTFTPGLEGLGERLLAKKRDAAAQKAETVWQAYLRRKREKKEAERAKGRHNVSSGSSDDSDGSGSPGAAAAADGSSDPFFQHEEGDPFADPFFQDDGEAAAAGGALAREAARDKARGKRREEGAAAAAAAEEDARRRAVLELLLLDEERLAAGAAAGTSAAGVQGAASAVPAMSKASRKERLRAAKAERASARAAGSDDEDLAATGAVFQPDLADPRFAPLFGNPDFALDPTDPRFGKATGAAAVAAAVAKKRGARADAAAPREQPAPPAPAAGEPAAKRGRELQAMVTALKRKAGAAAAPRRGDDLGKKKKRGLA